VVVGVRVLRTFDFIDELHTELFHNHPSLVIFNGGKKIAGIKVADGDLLLRKE